jgi:hypothetical protein
LTRLAPARFIDVADERVLRMRLKVSDRLGHSLTDDVLLVDDRAGCHINAVAFLQHLGDLTFTQPVTSHPQSHQADHVQAKLAGCHFRW